MHRAIAKQEVSDVKKMLDRAQVIEQRAVFPAIEKEAGTVGCTADERSLYMKKKVAAGKKTLATVPQESSGEAGANARMEAAFAEVVRLIEQARQRAYQAVNTELVGLYWRIGEYIRGKLAEAEWGEGVVDNLALHLARTLPGQRGFTRRNLFRMRQFFETYRGDEKVTALLSQLPWTHNLIILTQANGLKNVSSICGWLRSSAGAAANWSGSFAWGPSRRPC